MKDFNIKYLNILKLIEKQKGNNYLNICFYKNKENIQNKIKLFIKNYKKYIPISLFNNYITLGTFSEINILQKMQDVLIVFAYKEKFLNTKFYNNLYEYNILLLNNYTGFSYRIEDNFRWNLLGFLFKRKKLKGLKLS